MLDEHKMHVFLSAKKILGHKLVRAEYLTILKKKRKKILKK